MKKTVICAQEWPEACRAIVMAAGKNIYWNTWYVDKNTDQHDGCGRANGIDAYNITGNRYYGGSTPGPKSGWYA